MTSWIATFPAMTTAEAKAWLDPHNYDVPTLGDYISALKGVEAKSLHEINGHLDVSEAISELAFIDALPGSHTEKLPRTNRFIDALNELADGPAATEYGSMTDTIDAEAIAEEVTNDVPTAVLELIELGRTIARLEAEDNLTVATLASNTLGTQEEDDNPLDALRAYVRELVEVI